MMLFHSYAFLVLFLPTVLLLTFLLTSYSLSSAALSWFLIAASLFFYGFWEPTNLWIILCSICANVGFAHGIRRFPKSTSTWLSSGVVFNLFLLGYFKYASPWFGIATGPLPLAISFFTFQQIAYLVCVSRREEIPSSGSEYLLFVTFFPQLIAGPIVQHNQVVEQFRQLGQKRNWVWVASGFFLFALGWSKKIWLADPMGRSADLVFGALPTHSVGFFDAWLGLCGFGLQIYFDFSGYSDMAIGLAMLFGIRLPINFDSPYKATNPQVFWRKWHITLSVFLRDHLYIPLGGNRTTRWKWARNIIITMALGGIWHGAGVNFLIWGLLHGFYLVLYRFWSSWSPLKQWLHPWLARALGCAFTFVLVMLAWVWFRAPSFSSAIAMNKALFGFNGMGLPHEWRDLPLWGALLSQWPGALKQHTLLANDAFIRLFGCLLFVFCLPNSNQLARLFQERLAPGLVTLLERICRRLFPLRMAIGFALGVCWFYFAFLYKSWFVDSSNMFLYFQF
jgi:D-alanyl-lipoteichoic acid acyltransferase DltB (MBOAT superfamily)